MPSVPLAPRRVKVAPGDRGGGSGEKRSIVASWITDRLLYLAQSAPSIAETNQGTGARARVDPASLDSQEQLELDFGQLQMKKAWLVCMHCKLARRGSRLTSVCNPPECEYGNFVLHRDDLSEDSIAGRALFGDVWHSEIRRLQIHERTNFSVSADCYICDKYAVQKAQAVLIGDTAGAHAAAAALSRHHHVNQTFLKGAENSAMRDKPIQN